ncbi:alpha/beta fold hydrolase [Kribbella kalugense]|uniref:Pimeloyl-ACP methyl ester carboxylesterase n=1 Tax=Kribbella kalugense TaxID=2512221 RepID=A0A4R7ZRP0_9ACTN|nr:alpha/beta hydrolase [Kribbella kalugense]TDW19491.1 pimeloyl-ACP methyl ester carboxylesterase [Kribbella kalugense]
MIETWEGGDPAGVPVVFQHGTPAGRLQASLGDAAAKRLGVRLISFSRPGYGRSTNTPPSLASVAQDTLRVADELGVDEFAVLGASGGGPYAIATGIADPRRVKAVGLAGGTGPWRLIEPPDLADSDLPLLALADAGDVAGALDGFRRQGVQDFDGLLTLDDEAMVTAYFKGAPKKDLGWLDVGVWAADAREALASYDGYARDNVAWGGAWDVDPADLRVPTWLWYGEIDRLVPASHGRWLADRIRQSTLIVRPGEGHGTTIFGHWEDMLTTLVTIV